VSLTTRYRELGSQRIVVKPFVGSKAVSGTVELESTAYLDASAGRAEFQIKMKRGWGAPQNYQVFGMKKGLLMLNLGAAGSNSQFEGKLGTVGGLLGGGIGRAIGYAVEHASESPLSQPDSVYTRFSDAKLVEKAREHKGSLVADYDEITSVSIDQPSVMQSLTRGGAVAGMITVHEKTLGKMIWDVCDQASLHSAFEFLPAKLGDKVRVKIEYDPAKLRYVRRSDR